MKKLHFNTQITTREAGSLDKYLQEIERIDMIDAEEEVRLAKKIKNGDCDALEKLATSNLRFVVSVAKQYQNQGLPLNDLINEGNMGLIKAAERFDDSYGFKFISYAVWWIRQSILQALAEQSRVVRIPAGKVSAIVKISKAKSEMEQMLGREPTLDEISEHVNVNSVNIMETMKGSIKLLSVDAPFSKGTESCLLDVLPDTNNQKPDSNLIKESENKEVKMALSKLSKNEAFVLKLYFGLDDVNGRTRTLEEIGDQLGCTRERVRQIKEDAIRKLRHSSALQKA